MTDSFNRTRTSMEHLRAVAAAMRAADIALYLADDMDGATFADNELRGDHDPGDPALSAWAVRRDTDRMWTMRVAVRGAEHGLYEAGPTEHDQLVVRYQAVHRFAEQRLEPALRDAGMDVRSIEMAGFDPGWGSRDVHFDVRYRPSD